VRKIIPLTRILKKIILVDGTIKGGSQRLEKLLASVETSLGRKIYFADTRTSNDPNVIGFRAVSQRTVERITIFFDPRDVTENEIAHELVELKLGTTYPILVFRTGIKQTPGMNHLRSQLLSGLIDFEVEKQVKTLGFDLEKSAYRDKKFFLQEWEKDKPYDSPQFSSEKNWNNVRIIISGMILAQFIDELSPEEMDLIERNAINEKKISREIAALFINCAHSGLLSTQDGFLRCLTTILEELQLSKYFLVMLNPSSNGKDTNKKCP
jgi:hypothetical protein